MAALLNISDYDRQWIGMQK